METFLQQSHARLPLPDVLTGSSFCDAGVPYVPHAPCAATCQGLFQPVMATGDEFVSWERTSGKGVGWHNAFDVLAQGTAELRLWPMSPGVCPTACFHTWVNRFSLIDRRGPRIKFLTVCNRGTYSCPLGQSKGCSTLWSSNILLGVVERAQFPPVRYLLRRLFLLCLHLGTKASLYRAGQQWAGHSPCRGFFCHHSQ